MAFLFRVRVNVVVLIVECPSSTLTVL